MSGASVEVDVYSGRENPVVPLSDHTAQNLQEFIDEHEAGAERVNEPQWPLGFRGFLVTFDGVGWSSARVLEESVYVEDATGLLRIADGPGVAYRLIWDEIRAEMDATVVTAVEESG